MSRLRVIVDRFEDSNGQYAIWSILCVSVENRYFPDKEWYDATSSVLTMWLGQVRLLLQGSSSKETLYFMDGDYSLLLQTANQRVAKLCWVAGESVVFCGEVDLLYFARQLLAAVGKMQQHFWNKKEIQPIQEISQEADQLRKEIKKQRAENSSLS